MVYIIVFIIMCLLDKKFDTYMFYKFMGTVFLSFVLFIVGTGLYSGKEKVIDTTTENFITSNLGSKKTGALSSSSKNIFYYSTKNGVKEFNSDNISEFKKGDENKITIKTSTYPTSAKFWFFLFLDNQTAYIEYKE